MGDLPVVMVKKTAGVYSFYPIHADHLNAPRVILNAANVPVWRWDNSDAFGLGSPNQDPDGDGTAITYNLRFPGQYYDKETGLHYNYFRDYDPNTGRYLESDPIGLAGGMNTYAYVGGNPVNRIDPTGKVAILPWIIACAADPLCWGPIAAGATYCASQVHDINRKSLNDIIRDLTNGGRKPLSADDADAAIDLGNELGIPGVRDDRDTDHWEGGPHIHIPGTRIPPHIPADPQPEASSNE